MIPTPGEHCRAARRGRVDYVLGMSTAAICAALGISRVTLRAWERASDERLVAWWWRERGLHFDYCCHTEILRGHEVMVAGGGPIEHLRAWDPTTNEQLVRVDDPATSREYSCDEAAGTYRVASCSRADRRVAVAFLRRKT